MLKLFECVSVHCSQHLQGEYEVGGGNELIHRSQQGAKVQLWNVMMCFGRDHVIKDWQKRCETSFHSVCIHLVDCGCRIFQCLAWCGGT